MSLVSQRPRLLFFGVGSALAGVASVAQADLGTTDNGNAFTATAITSAIVPAEPSQEILVFATYLTVVHQLDAAADLVVSLFVDDRTPLTATVTVPASDASRTSRYEVGWYETVQSGVASATQAPRGYRVRVGVEVPPQASGLLDIDGIECEIEVRAESISPVNAR